MCHFLQDGTAEESPLAALNEDETPGAVDYYTIRGVEDPLFMQRPDSPALDGATNVALETDHDGARESLDSLELVYEWVADESPYNVRTFV